MNLKDFSQLLGLSQTTVSRALNGFPEVSSKTREKVKRAAIQHGYRPSAAARRLATGQSGTLGIIFPHQRNMLADLVFTEFLSGCLESAADLGYDITLSQTQGQISEELVYRRAVRSARVDGMILSSPLLHDPRPALLQSLNMPCILHGRTAENHAISYLDIDNETAFFNATQLLCDLGHDHIALLNGVTDYTFASHRLQGYCNALRAAGKPVMPALIASGTMVESFGYAQGKALLGLPLDQRPTAFLCSSILITRGLRRALLEAGLTIGRDISLITHDDGLIDFGAAQFDPPLTATQSSIRKAGRHITSMLVKQIRGDIAMPAQIVWPVELVVRQSTGPAPARS